MLEHFLFPWPKSKMFWWIFIQKNAKKTPKNAFFANFGHYMEAKSIRNTVFGLAVSNYPYLDTFPDSLPFRGAKRWPRASEPDFVGKSGPYTFWSVRPSLGVESRVRCWFLCLDTLQVQRLCIQVISTPSSGRKMRKTCILAPNW